MTKLVVPVKNPATDKKDFSYWKRLILSYLDSLEGSMQKSRGFAVGTIRTWKGTRYIKMPNNKWRPKYDSQTRGAKMAISVIKHRVDSAKDEQELMNIILENRDRFSDQYGHLLPFVQELHEYVNKKQMKPQTIHQAELPQQENNKLTTNYTQGSEKQKQYAKNIVDNLNKEIDKANKLAPEAKKEIQTVVDSYKTRITDNPENTIDYLKNKTAEGIIQQAVYISTGKERDYLRKISDDLYSKKLQSQLHPKLTKEDYDKITQKYSKGYWNGKVYGQPGNQAIYISGGKYKISDEDAKILTE